MRHHTLAFAVVPLVLAGCTVGPNYVKPSAPMTPAFKEAPPEAYKDAGVWNPARPSDDLLRAKWWEIFGDPELNALEEQVEVGNQDLKAAAARFRQARAMVGYARSSEFPTIGVGPEISSVGDSVHQPHFRSQTSRSTGDFALSFDLSYEIDLWGRISRGVTAAGEEAQATAADLETVRLSLHAELAMDYFELRSADAQQKLLDDTTKAYGDSLQLTEYRLEGGESPASDVAQAKTQLDTSRVRDTDIAEQRAQYEHAIAVLIGKPPAAFNLPPSPLTGQPPAVPVSVPSELLERRPDIAAAERRAGEANEQIGIAESAYYPSLSLNSLGGFEGTSPASLFWAVGLSMAQTVFDGGRRDATTEAVRAAYDASIADYRQSTLFAFQQVEDNLAALRILEREAQQQDEAVASAQNNLRIFTDRYTGGRDNYLQVITAQTEYLANESNAVDIERRRMDATVLLVKALGGGWTTSALPTLDQVTHPRVDPSGSNENETTAPAASSPAAHTAATGHG